MMKYQKVSNNNMFKQGPSFPIKIKSEISVEDWEVFEELADNHKRLWDIFWNISNDKKNVIKKDVCAIYYLEEIVLPNLAPTMEYLVKGGHIDNNGLTVILSLFINMIPKEKCKHCSCRTEQDDWITKI